jgi:hypothetical protein
MRVERESMSKRMGGGETRALANIYRPAQRQEQKRAASVAVVTKAGTTTS